MRLNKVCGLALAASGVAGLAGQAGAAVYNGNGANGFGGGVGNSMLTVTDGGSTINFSLATSRFDGNALAIYLDTVPGGFNNTSAFTDNADGGRTVLSGFGTNGRTLATFAPGFGADYGISLQPADPNAATPTTGFAGIFNLTQTNGSFGFVASGGLDLNATSTLNFSVNKADVGLAATNTSFSFEATLISPTAYRSNETIGASVVTADPGNPGTLPNAGFTGSVTFSAANQFGTAVPEPTSLAAAAVGGLALSGRRRNRH